MSSRINKQEKWRALLLRPFPRTFLSDIHVDRTVAWPKGNPVASVTLRPATVVVLHRNYLPRTTQEWAFSGSPRWRTPCPAVFVRGRPSGWQLTPVSGASTKKRRGGGSSREYGARALIVASRARFHVRARTPPSSVFFLAICSWYWEHNTVMLESFLPARTYFSIVLRRHMAPAAGASWHEMKAKLDGMQRPMHECMPACTLDDNDSPADGHLETSTRRLARRIG